MVGSVRVQRCVAVGAACAWLVAGVVVVSRSFQPQGSVPWSWTFPVMLLASVVAVTLTVCATVLWVLPTMFEAWSAGVEFGRDVARERELGAEVPVQQTRDVRRGSRLHSVH